MLAYRKNNHDGYIEFHCELDDNGKPILPENSTIEPPPPYKEGFSRTIDGNKWVYVKLQEPPKPSVEDVRPYKLMEFKIWKEEYLTSAFEYEGVEFSLTPEFKDMLNDSISAYNLWGELPQFLIGRDGEIIENITPDFLLGLGKKTFKLYQDRMLEVLELENKIKNVDNVFDLERITFLESESE